MTGVRVISIRRAVIAPVIARNVVSMLMSVSVVMAPKHHDNVCQGSEEWFAMRAGLLTASEMKHILTPSLKIANNDKTRQHVYEIAAQRISDYVEPSYVGDDMLRGQMDELEAKTIYNSRFAQIEDCGFITNDKWGFTIGYSPDALVGDDGLIEIKSRRQKYQVQTLIDHWQSRTVPVEFILQIQTGLLVSEREWCDFISYSGGMPMIVIRAYPDDEVQEAILNASREFEDKVDGIVRNFRAAVANDSRLIPTERKDYEEIAI